MKKSIKTDKAPTAIGPYSQAIAAGGFIFVSGQIPIDPATGQIVSDDVSAQTDQVIRNIRSILDEAGASLLDVVKTTVFLADMNDFADMNEVYARHFEAEAPARAAVQVSRLPKDVRVEIEAIAFIGD